MNVHRATETAIALRLPREERAQIQRWAAGGYPNEACGLLLGRPGAARTDVELATHARNLAVERARDRYELDPFDQLAAENDARARGLEVVGVWHSHPDHPARPSETDRQRAW